MDGSKLADGWIVSLDVAASSVIIWLLNIEQTLYPKIFQAFASMQAILIIDDFCRAFTSLLVSSRRSSNCISPFLSISSDCGSNREIDLIFENSIGWYTDEQRMSFIYCFTVNKTSIAICVHRYITRFVTSLVFYISHCFTIVETLLASFYAFLRF